MKRICQEMGNYMCKNDNVDFWIWWEKSSRGVCCCQLLKWNQYAQNDVITLKIGFNIFGLHMLQ
jgi:hypothetical protein